MTTSRRLAAILAADVVGYSRLMGADDEGTLHRLKAVRADIVDPAVAQYRGRIFKTTGDGLLAEFGSVVDAMRCATAVQRAMFERNTGAPAQSRLNFRIGVHVGDVIIDGDDIYGDGVNIAARLEAIAQPGGISISARVYEDARGHVEAEFEDCGEQTLKNIDRNVRVYRVRVGEPAVPRAQVAPHQAAGPRQGERALPASGMRHIGYVGVGPRPVVDEFRRALIAYGYVDDQTIKIHYRWSAGVYSRNPDLVRELIQLPVELIVADATPAVAAAKEATGTIPIVMVGVGDPVAYGIVPSLIRPGANITGMSGGLYEYLPRGLRLLREILPQAVRVTILAPTAIHHPGIGPAVKVLEDAAHALDMIPRVLYADTPDELRAVLAAIDRRTDILAVIPDHSFLLNRAIILAAAAAANIPVFCPSPEYVPDGALISVGPNRTEVYRRLAYFVDAVLKGTPPNELPVEEPSKHWLLLNLKAARALGITIPGPILMRADELID
jgi:class 3 adenylate cyclase/ABC-type uncharacterized transport system substrate-binding protein